MGTFGTARRLDLTEVFLVALFVGLCGLLAGRAVGARVTYADYATQLEATRLKTTYGPEKYSENLEEWIIRDFFKDRSGGFFVDVGANDYRHDSNTYYLETRLGWSGVAVDPQATFEADYVKYRPRTRFFAFFVSDVSGESAELFVADRNSSAVSTERGFTQQFGSRVSEFRAPTTTLTDLLDQVHAPSIDFLSIDVELAEPKVLAGFDIRRFRPTLVCIEAHREVRQQIFDYFARHSYVIIGRYLGVDTQNVYFTHLD
jgi:FkbM family methyltransferase